MSFERHEDALNVPEHYTKLMGDDLEAFIREAYYGDEGTKENPDKKNRRKWTAHTNCLRSLMCRLGLKTADVADASGKQDERYKFSKSYFLESQWPTPSKIRDKVPEISLCAFNVLLQETRRIDNTLRFAYCLDRDNMPFIYWGGYDADTGFEVDMAPQGEQIRAALNLITRGATSFKKDVLASYLSEESLNKVMHQVLHNEKRIGFHADAKKTEAKQWEPAVFKFFEKYGMAFTLNRNTGQKGLRLTLNKDIREKLHAFDIEFDENKNTVDLTPAQVIQIINAKQKWSEAEIEEIFRGLVRGLNSEEIANAISALAESDDDVFQERNKNQVEAKIHALKYELGEVAFQGRITMARLEYWNEETGLEGE